MSVDESVKVPHDGAEQVLDDPAVVNAMNNPRMAIQTIAQWKNEPYARELALRLAAYAAFESDFCWSATSGYYAPSMLRKCQEWADATWANDVIRVICRHLEFREIMNNLASWRNTSLAETIFRILLNLPAMTPTEIDDMDDFHMYDDPSPDVDPMDRTDRILESVEKGHLIEVLRIIESVSPDLGAWVTEIRTSIDMALSRSR